MPDPLVIIITGPPCTGKTTLGRKLADELHLCFISRDDIKESLFDSLGWKDRKWSIKLGGASYGLLYQFAESLLKVGVSFILESNFDPERSTPEILKLKQKYGFKSFQINCKTDGKVLFQRFKIRSESGERHPGHVDHVGLEDHETRLLTGASPSLDIGDPVLDVDTTDFEKVSFVKIVSTIKNYLAEQK